MSNQESNSVDVPPKKKSKRTLIIVLIALVVLAIPTCGVVGVLVAISVPALALAKQDAQDAIAKNIFNAVGAAQESFLKEKGRAPQTWGDIAPYITLKGKSAPSAGDLMSGALGGGSLEVRGIDGAPETKITLKDGRVITPSSAAGSKGPKPSGSSGPSGPSGSFGARSTTSSAGVPNPKDYDSQQLMSAVFESGENLEKIHLIISVSQQYYNMVDWRALAELPQQDPKKVEELYAIFTKMGKNTMSAVPYFKQVEKTSLPPEIVKLYKDVLEDNVAMCSSAQKFIKTFRSTGQPDVRQYTLIINYDKEYATSLGRFIEFNDSFQ